MPLENLRIGFIGAGRLGSALAMESYRLLCRRTVDLALQRGAIDTATADQLRALLRNTLPPPR